MCMNTKRHVCGICVKLKSLLKTHYRQVYGASLPLVARRPCCFKTGRSSSARFSCGTCKKWFRFRSSLETHVCTHPVKETHLGIKIEVKLEGDENDYAGDSMGDCDDSVNESVGEYNIIVSERDEKPLGDGQYYENEGVHHANDKTNEQDEVISDSEQTIPDTTNYGNTIEDIFDTPTIEYRNTCKYCSEEFETNELLTAHLRKAHRSKLTHKELQEKNKCGYCKFETLYKSALNRHIKAYHPFEQGVPQHFSCTFCQEQFTAKRHLWEHVKSTHKKKRNKSYLNILPDEKIELNAVPEALQENIETKVVPEKSKEIDKRSEEKDICPICFKLCGNRKGVRNHLYRVHKLSTKIFKKKSADGENYPCSICGEVYQDETAVLEHTRSVHNLLKAECPVCKKQYSKKGMQAHLTKVHKVYARQRKLESEKFPCTVCRKVYQDKKGLQDHIQEKHQSSLRQREGFLCPLCPRRYKSVKSVRDHARSFHNRPWSSFDDEVKESVKRSSNLPKASLKPPPQMPRYKCKICSKLFKHPVFLRGHMRKHTGERPYTCEVCGKGFAFNATLSHHLNTHRDEKPYKCTYCERRFNTPTGRRVHILTHTREYNHSCHICGKSFLIGYQLVKHLKWHAGEKDHKCDQCPKAFLTSFMLKTHKRVHTKEQPYVCDACGVAYRWRYNFVQHLRAKHPALLKYESPVGRGTYGAHRDTTKELIWIRYVTPDAQGSTEWHGRSSTGTEDPASMDQSGLGSTNQSGADLMGGANGKL